MFVAKFQELLSFIAVIIVRSLRVRFHFLDRHRNRLQCSVFTLSLPLEASAIFLLQSSTVYNIYVQPFNLIPVTVPAIKRFLHRVIPFGLFF